MLISSDDTRRKGFQRAGRARRKKELRPLRKIVGYDAGKEVLECGHEQHPREDIAGATNAARRRCRRKRHGARDAQPTSLDTQQEKL